MAIDKDVVKYIAKLARLELSNKEIDYFTSQLGHILDYIGQLKDVDTSKIEPTSHVVSIKNIFHEDIAGPSLSRDLVLRGAPAAEGGLFKVPRIIEGS